MTLLIRRAQIVGGTADSEKLTDVFVNGERISAIGDFPSKHADAVIDAHGAYCAPGFIDINTDSDHYLSILNYPEQADFIRQGVTTIIGGMCGSSLAPLLYGSLESVQKWGDIGTVNVDWHTLAEFLSMLDRKPLSVNFATLIGHSTIRRALVGESIRELTKSELAVFERTLRTALEEGGFGLSTGLGYVHSFKTPQSEIKFLCETVKALDGVYATHLRTTGNEIGTSVEETIRIAKGGPRTVISHFLPLAGAEREYEEALQKIESLPVDVNLKFDVYPSDTSVLAIYTFLPSWAKNGGRQTMLANIKDEWLQRRIEKDLPEVNPDHFVIAHAPGNEFLVGKSLKNIATLYDIANYKMALRKLMEATDLRAIILYKNINKNLVSRALKSSHSFIASNAASFRDTPRILKPERAKNTFPAYLEMTADAARPSSLREAVRKITIEPARYFGIRERGEIKEGNYADLVVFSLSKKGGPEERRVEIKNVVVNGEVAFENGALQEKRSGKNLRRERS